MLGPTTRRNLPASGHDLPPPSCGWPSREVKVNHLPWDPQPARVAPPLAPPPRDHRTRGAMNNRRRSSRRRRSPPVGARFAACATICRSSLGRRRRRRSRWSAAASGFTCRRETNLSLLPGSACRRRPWQQHAACRRPGRCRAERHAGRARRHGGHARRHGGRVGILVR